MRLYSYVVAHDHGFAPNPFWGHCTLATCKPRIRLRAAPGDWVIGTGSTRAVGKGRLVFAMGIKEKLPFNSYNAARRFAKKKPRHDKDIRLICGDNIYYKVNGRWRQRASFHRHAQMAHDVRGKYVLIAKEFYYFGVRAPMIPSSFRTLVPVGRGHRCRFDARLVARLIRWLRRKRRGIHADPWLFKHEHAG